MSQEWSRPTLTRVRIYVMTSASLSAALTLSVVLIHPGISVWWPALPDSPEVTHRSVAVLASAPVSCYLLGMLPSGVSPVLGSAAQAARSSSARGEQSKSDDRQDCTDINTAGTEDLQRAKGVGPVKAKAIIDDRKASGPYSKLEDLERVKGIGPATLENIRQAGFCVK